MHDGELCFATHALYSLTITGNIRSDPTKSEVKILFQKPFQFLANDQIVIIDKKRIVKAYSTIIVLQGISPYTSGGRGT